MAFDWTPERIKAAELMGLGELSKQAIAKEIGVDRKTLYNWAEAPEFKARVAEAVEDYGGEARRIGIASQTNRLIALNGLFNKLTEIMDERARDPLMAEAPGGIPAC